MHSKHKHQPRGCRLQGHNLSRTHAKYDELFSTCRSATQERASAEASHR